MKIVHVTFSDNYGGAAIAAKRHCLAMKKQGIDASMLVVHKYEKNKSFIKSIYNNKIFNFIKEKINLYSERLLLKRFTPKGTFSFPLLGNSIHNHPLIQTADIIYLHWVNHSMLSIKDIENLLRTNKTIYWFLHDMYPLTGGCHHSFECNKYKSKCNKCSLLNDRFNLDIAQKQFNKKFKRWNKYNNFKIISPSKWLSICATESAIFRNHQIYICPNPIDSTLFKPIDKIVAKSIMNLDLNKKTLIFSADNKDNHYKGWIYLKQVLNKLDCEKYQCLILGDYNETIDNEIQIKTTYTGYIHDDYSLMVAYNAADILVIPSLAENFPNVIVEAMSCGIPCIGFNVGGIPDLISTGKTGYLAEYKNVNDLKKGIEFCLENNDIYETLSKNARKFIEEYCSYNKVKDYYKDLHQQ